MFEQRETSVIVELLHPDSREPERLKITPCFPILSSFGTACPGCFDFIVIYIYLYSFCERSPGMLEGHRRPLPVTWFPIVVLTTIPKCTQTRDTWEGKACAVTLLNISAGGPA